MQTAMFMMAIGLQTELTEMAPTNMLMEPAIQDSGSMTNSMAKVSRPGLMAHATKACIVMARRMEKEF